MDFTLDETQAELRDLAKGLFGRETAGAPYDTALWAATAKAGLVGACLPEESGGAGLGAAEMAVVLREAGAHVAPIPLQDALVAGMVVGRHGSAGQRAALTRLAEGEIVLTAAPLEPGRELGAEPATTAREDGDRRLLTGRKTMVGHAAGSAAILVPARTPRGVGLFLVRPQDAAVHPVPTATGEPAAALTLDDTPGDPVGADDGAAFTLLRLLTLAAITATASGVLAGALELTTQHIRTRKQFDRVLAEFQAVTMQIADVYIAGRALDVAMWSGAWRIDQGLHAEAELDLAVAAHTVADAGLLALYTCQHLHGGLGLDVTYPLHRYFAWAKHRAHLLGGVEARLDAIGELVRC